MCISVMQVAELNDEGNWRSGLRVRLMHKRMVCQNMVSDYVVQFQFL